MLNDGRGNEQRPRRAATCRCRCRAGGGRDHRSAHAEPRCWTAVAGAETRQAAGMHTPNAKPPPVANAPRGDGQSAAGSPAAAPRQPAPRVSTDDGSGRGGTGPNGMETGGGWATPRGWKSSTALRDSASAQRARRPAVVGSEAGSLASVSARVRSQLLGWPHCR
mgnify:CR=1 FL=1